MECIQDSQWVVSDTSSSSRSRSASSRSSCSLSSRSYTCEVLPYPHLPGRIHPLHRGRYPATATHQDNRVVLPHHTTPPTCSARSRSSASRCSRSRSSRARCSSSSACCCAASSAASRSASSISLCASAPNHYEVCTNGRSLSQKKNRKKST